MPDETELDTADTVALATEQDTQATSTPDAGVDAAAAATPDQGTGDAEADTSLTTDSTVADEKSDAAAGQPAQDYESRYKELQREFTRRSQELKRYRESLGDADPAEVAQRIKAQQEAQSAQAVAPWNPQSPHHQRFSQALSNYGLFKQQISKVPEDQREAVANAWRDAFTDEDLRAIKAFEQHQNEEQRRMVSDPAYMASRIREEAMAVVRQELSQQQEVSKWTQFFSSPEVAPLVQQHGRALHALMQGGMSADEAVEYVRGQSRQVAQAQVQSDRKAAAADAQRALAKGHASVSRDKTGQVAADPVVAARRLLKARGVAETSQSLSMALYEVAKNQSNQ
jgi:hypothetical protein